MDATIIAAIIGAAATLGAAWLTIHYTSRRGSNGRRGGADESAGEGIEPLRVSFRNGDAAMVGVTFGFRIISPTKFLQMVGSDKKVPPEEMASKHLDPYFRSATAGVLETMTIEELRVSRSVTESKIRSSLEPKLARLGMKMENVHITSIGEPSDSKDHRHSSAANSQRVEQGEADQPPSRRDLRIE